MSDHPAYTRREFLGSGLAVVSTASTIPTFLTDSAKALSAPEGALVSSRPGVPEDRILVVVQLSGGNDGLNTVVPYGHDAYYRARPVLGVAADQVSKFDQKNGLGLHPEMRAFNQMIDDGLAAVVHGVGYPNPNRSHFASMDVWHTGDTLGKGAGWIGQAMDQIIDDEKSTDGTACICTGREAPLAAQGRRYKPVAFESANVFRWSGQDLHAQLGDEYDRINRAGVVCEPAADQQNDQLAFIMRTSLDAQLASDRIRAAVAKRPITRFPQSPFSRQLQMVAAMIRDGLSTRVYYVGLGGFDTHAGQLRRHSNLLRQFAQGMQAFYGELKAIDAQERVLTMAFSEFGRRVYQNASQGTDHGTAGPVFLAGPMIRPGSLGTHPSLSEFDQGDLIYNTDFRCIYASILDQWLKIDSATVLRRRFKPASILNRSYV